MGISGLTSLPLWCLSLSGSPLQVSGGAVGGTDEGTGLHVAEAQGQGLAADLLELPGRHEAGDGEMSSR